MLPSWDQCFRSHQVPPWHPSCSSSCLIQGQVNQVSREKPASPLLPCITTEFCPEGILCAALSFLVFLMLWSHVVRVHLYAFFFLTKIRCCLWFPFYKWRNRQSQIPLIMMKRKLIVLEPGEKSVTSSPHLTINQSENVTWSALPQGNKRGSKALGKMYTPHQPCWKRTGKNKYLSIYV